MRFVPHHILRGWVLLILKKGSWFEHAEDDAALLRPTSGEALFDCVDLAK
jgi:hypothetical protein